VVVTPSEVRLQGKVSYLFSLPLSDLDLVLSFVLICLDIYISALNVIGYQIWTVS
jgi:hypothetical protein